jgi:hypothetical protein
MVVMAVAMAASVVLQVVSALVAVVSAASTVVMAVAAHLFSKVAIWSNLEAIEGSIPTK